MNINVKVFLSNKKDTHDKECEYVEIDKIFQIYNIIDTNINTYNDIICNSYSVDPKPHIQHNNFHVLKLETFKSGTIRDSSLKRDIIKSALKNYKPEFKYIVFKQL